MGEYPTGREAVAPANIVASEDNMSFEGARRLGRTISNYWKARGFSGVEVVVEQLPFIQRYKTVDGVRVAHETEKLYGVRSNLTNGLPRG